MSVHDEPQRDESSYVSFLTSPSGLVLIGFLAIGAVYLWMEHSAHLLGVLVWLPLFMHHGHGDHSGDGSSSSSRENK